MLLKKLAGLQGHHYLGHKILKHNTPLATSLISSNSFSSSSKNFWSFGMFSWSLGIRFLESSDSFVISPILDESCITTQVRYMRAIKKKVNHPSITINLLKFILEFLDFLLHMLQVLPMLYVLPFKLFEFLLTDSKFIIKNLTIAKEDKVINHFWNLGERKLNLASSVISMRAEHICISDVPLVSSYVFHAQTQILLTLYYSHPFSLCNRNGTIFVNKWVHIISLIF